MLNNFLREETWSQGKSAQDDQGNEVRWDSEEAAKRDLTSWIKYMYLKEEDRDRAINKLKSVINTDPLLMGVDVDREKYQLSPQRSIPLWCWNDTANWNQVSRLITLVNLQ